MEPQRRRCPRCLLWYDEDYFQPPVTICLLCYRRNRGNEELDLPELREKARGSITARRRIAREQRKADLALLARGQWKRTSTVQHTASIPLKPGQHICPNCERVMEAEEKNEYFIAPSNHKCEGDEITACSQCKGEAVLEMFKK